MKRRLAAIALCAIAFTIGANLPIFPAHADYMGSRFFDGNKPVCVSLYNIDNARVRAALTAAAKNWDNQTTLDVRARANCTPGGYKQRIQPVDASYGRNGWYGLAVATRSWWAKSPTPYRWTVDGWTYLHDRVEIRFNLTYLLGLSDSQMQSVAAHEIGHALGLAHRDRSDAVMTEQGFPRYVKYWDTLGTWDHPGVNRIYWEG